MMKRFTAMATAAVMVVMAGSAGAQPFIVSDPNPSCAGWECFVEVRGIAFDYDAWVNDDGSIAVDVGETPAGVDQVPEFRLCRKLWAGRCSQWVPFGFTSPSAPSNPGGFRLSVSAIRE